VVPVCCFQCSNKVSYFQFHWEYWETLYQTKELTISVLLIAPLVKVDCVPCGDGKRSLSKCWYMKQHSRLDSGCLRLSPAFKI
jgi:hypothetical protein